MFTFWYMVSLPKITDFSPCETSFIYSSLSKYVIINFPPVFWKSAVEKNVVQKVPPKTDVCSQSTKFQSTSLLLLRYKTRGPTPLGRSGAKISQRSFQSFPTTWHCLHPNWLQSVSVWGQSTERTQRGTIKKQWKEYQRVTSIVSRGS